MLTAVSARSYRTLATEHEALMQKYLHLLQIVETEKTVAKQLRQQIEDGEIEIERLKAEVTSAAPPPAVASRWRSDDGSNATRLGLLWTEGLGVPLLGFTLQEPCSEQLWLPQHSACAGRRGWH